MGQKRSSGIAMRLSNEQIKAAILAPDQEMRQAAVFYCSRSHSSDLAVTLRAIEAIERFGWNDAFSMYSFLPGLAQNQATVDSHGIPRTLNGVRSMLSSEFPELLQYLAGTFNQDFNCDYPTADEAARAAAAEWLFDSLVKIQSELRAFTKIVEMSSEPSKVLLEMGCYYDPRCDGMTESQWLAHLQEIVSEGIRAKSTD